MPFTDKIVELINDNLQTEIFSKGKLSGSKLYELAYVQKREQDSGVDYVLMGYEKESETEVSFDDSYPATLYHRLLSGGNPTTQANKTGYGDDAVTLQGENSLLTLVVYSSRKIIHESTLASWIMEVLNNNYASADFAALGISSLKTVLISVNFDSATVWTTEFKNQNYPFSVEQLLFSIQYQIQATYSKGCFEKCCN